MSGADVHLTLAPYTLARLPSEHSLVNAGKSLLSDLKTWKEGRTFNQGKLSVRTLSRTKGPGDDAVWHARISEHTAEGSFEDFWDGLGRDKALKEQEYIPDLSKVTLLQSVSANQSLWSMLYKLPLPMSPRVFTVLQVTHLTGGDDGAPREGWVITVPVDVTEEAQLKNKEWKGVKGRYAAVERIAEGKDGRVEWTMATAGSPAGMIPQFVAEKTMPATISKDVFHFVEWLSKKNGTPAAADGQQPSQT